MFLLRLNSRLSQSNSLLRNVFALSERSGQIHNDKHTLSFTQSEVPLIRSTLLIQHQSTIRAASIDAVAGKKSTFDAKDELEIIDKLKYTFCDETADGGIVPIYKKALLYGNKIAIKDDVGEYSYAQLYVAAKMLSTQISNLCGSASNNRVAFLCSNTALYTLVQWACWMSGQIAVPLHPKHPVKLQEYFIKNSEASLIISVPEQEKLIAPLAESLEKPLIFIDHKFITTTTSCQSDSSWLDPKNDNVLMLNDRPCVEGTLNSKFYANANAMILFTSGTTAQPKGVVISHRNLDFQTKCISDAWRITEKDVILNCLPLNHVHGSINALACPLSIGAKVFMLPKFDSATVWSVLLNINMPSKDRISVFMGVPSIYNKLTMEFDKVFSKNERMIEFIRAQCEKKIRLMISGSAPLPTPFFDRWYEITGHRLLSRYGMTEIGMALSNPYEMDKVRTRSADAVGWPLPGVEVRIVDANGKPLVQAKGESDKGFWSLAPLPVYEKSDTVHICNDKVELVGELQVKGPNVITEYYNRPDETCKAFVDGWFKTGDIAKFENGVFKLLGRNSTDIIKSGGYKISALEVETRLLEHPDIKDVCIVGVDDCTWGQTVGGLLVLNDPEATEICEFDEWCTQNLAHYEKPSIIKIVKQLPRNELGKVNKNNVVKEYFAMNS